MTGNRSDPYSPETFDWDADVTLADLALLAGVSFEDALAEAERQGYPHSGRPFEIPEEWIRAARRRRGEFAARTGSYNMREALAWFAHERENG